MGKAETRLTKRMIDAGKKLYGERIVIVKYHGNEYSHAGVSDLLICLDGSFVAVEVKSDETNYGRKGATVLQQAFIGHVLTAGGVAAVCSSVEEFLETLAEVDRSNRDGCMWCNDRELQFPGSCAIHPMNQPTGLS